jgi:uncharacterized protein (DUF302 family)
MATHYSCKLRIPFKEAVEKITASLKEQGFGIITTIDLKSIFKTKSGIDFRDYMILGACNPDFAYKAVTLESHIGVMLPCNVVVQAHENGEVEISAVSPLEAMDRETVTQQINEIANEVTSRLRAAVDNLHRIPENALDRL